MRINFCTQKINTRNQSGKIISTYKAYKNTISRCDSFFKNPISFTSKDYSRSDIKTAKKLLKETDDNWKEKLYKAEYEDKKKNTPITIETSSYHGRRASYVDLNNPSDRIISDIMTLGLTEVLIVQPAYTEFRQEAREHVDKLDLIKTDILSAKMNEDEAENSKIQQNAIREMEYIEQINKIKENELYPKLLNKIQWEKEGKNVEVPNCVMLSHEDNRINGELIQWCLRQANANIEEIDLSDENFDFIDYLDNMEEKFQKTGDWNLIHVKNMGTMINPSKAEPHMIASMKAIMCSCAKDYHTTLLFSSTNPEELDDTAIESNRVTLINTSAFESLEDSKMNDILIRICDKNYITNCPLSAINDLVEYAKLDESFKLNFDSDATDIDKTTSEILNKITDFQKKKYKSILELAKEQAWYCTGIMPKKEVEIIPENKKQSGLNKVIGMDSLKEELYDEIIEPLKNPQKYKDYGIEGILNGFLLYGPPGCGKTFIIKSLADELERYYIEIKPSNVGSSYAHETAKNIAKKFNEARSNSPSIIFIDEIEAIAPRRDRSSGEDSADRNEQVTELLQQMNESKKKDILIVCASNEPQLIDNAIKRAGRIDKKIFVPNPDIKTRFALIENHLEKIKAKDNVDIDLVARKTDYYTAKDIEIVIRKASISALKQDKNVTTEDILTAISKYQPDLSPCVVESYKLKGEMK